MPVTPLPVTDWKSLHLGRLRRRARSAALHDRRRQRMLAAAFQAGGQAQQLVGVECRRPARR